MSSPFIEAFTFINDQKDLLWTLLKEHVVLSAEAVAISIGLGVPLGVFLGHLHRFSFLAINISNLGRALPSLAILAILLPVFGFGTVDVLIALVVLGFPPILTNAYVAVEQVDPEMVDAAKGIGLRPWQVLARVELPLSLPLVFAGIRTSAVFVVATAALAGIFGGGGLGNIFNNRESYGLDGVIGASYVLIVLAFLVQLAFMALERAMTPAGLKLSRKVAAGEMAVTPESLDADSPDLVGTEDEGAPSQGVHAATGQPAQQGRNT